MARIQKRRLYWTLVAILLSSVLAWGFGCGGGGGGDGGGAATQTFQAVAFFPLTSSWETDDWTLFIDERQHDVNGIMTKAMVNTSFPAVFFWTCDDDGLRLHAFVGEVGEQFGFYELSPAALFAAAVAKVGDRWEGTYTIKNEQGIDAGQIRLTAEIAGIEDVSVRAGNFVDCFKLVVTLYDPTDDSMDWKETWWLAEGVGLVKVESAAESDPDDGFFARGGETRQLLSYHITSSNLTPDEEAIKQLGRDFTSYFETENLVSMADLYSDNYDSRCRNKANRLNSLDQTFTNNEDLFHFASIGEIVMNADEAQSIVERFTVGRDAGTGFLWTDWQRSSNHMIKEGGEWKYYGDQVDFKINWMGVWTRKYHDESKSLVLGGKFIDCSDNPIEVDSFSVTGPPGTFTDLDLIPYWDGGYYDEYFLSADIADATDGFYTYTVGDVSGNTYQSTDYLEVLPLMDIQNLDSATVGGAAEPYNVTLKWDPVAEAHYYRVRLERDTGGGNWVDTDRALPDGSEIQWVFYNLSSATDYRWTVRARQDDFYGNMDNESRSDWAYFSTP